MAALHERGELQTRLKINANKQKHRAKVACHKIPAESLQFANHAELRAHFVECHLEDLANTNKNTEHLQAKVKKLEGRIAALVAKHSKGLAVGKLSAKWHTPSQIEEDIGKERVKLDGLQAELRKLELQVGEDIGEIGGNEEIGSSDEMGGIDKEDSDVLDVGNWGEEVEYMYIAM